MRNLRESTKRARNRRREDEIDEERMESTKGRRNRRREDGINNERMKSTKRMKESIKSAMIYREFTLTEFVKGLNRNNYALHLDNPGV